MSECQRCGTEIRGRTFCDSCAIDRRNGNLASQSADEPDTLVMQCVQCGERYLFAGDRPCPECNARHRRYVGQPDEYDGNFSGVTA